MESIFPFQLILRTGKVFIQLPFKLKSCRTSKNTNRSNINSLARKIYDTLSLIVHKNSKSHKSPTGSLRPIKTWPSLLCHSLLKETAAGCFRFSPDEKMFILDRKIGCKIDCRLLTIQMMFLLWVGKIFGTIVRNAKLRSVTSFLMRFPVKKSWCRYISARSRHRFIGRTLPG